MAASRSVLRVYSLLGKNLTEIRFLARIHDGGAIEALGPSVDGVLGGAEVELLIVVQVAR